DSSRFSKMRFSKSRAALNSRSPTLPCCCASTIGSGKWRTACARRSPPSPPRSNTRSRIMAEEIKKPKLEIVPKDAKDLDELWLDPGLGDGIVDVSYHTVPASKPPDFTRTHPDPGYRRRAEIYTHKPEGAIDEQHYIVGPEMQGRIPEARPCTLVTVIYRDGSPRLWPVKFPKDGERDNDAWTTAR